MPLKEARHQYRRDPEGGFGLEVLDIREERVLEAGGRNSASDQLGARILLGVARWLEIAAGREGVHAVDQAGLLQGMPDGFILGLNGVVAHGVHGADEGDAAPLGSHTINLLHGELGVLHGE